MAGFGIWWAPFEEGHEFTSRMGIDRGLKLPVLLEWEKFQTLLRGEQIDYRIENVIIGMLVVLNPYPMQLESFDPNEFADALKHLGRSCGDNTCEGMIEFAYSYMSNDQTDDDAKAIGKVAKMYFGINDYYIGDN
jgi:hypothetical protein